MSHRAVAIIVVLSALVCTAALAKPPSATGHAAVVGRVQFRDRIVDLSRASIAEGGAAYELVRGRATVMADIMPTEQRAPSDLAPRSTEPRGASRR